MSECQYWKKGQCLAYPAEIEPCKMVSVRCPTRLTLERDAALAALADLRIVTEGLAQRLRDPFYEGLDEGYVSCDMCSSEEGRPGPRRSCEGCNETGGCGDYELMHSYDAWKEKNP